MNKVSNGPRQEAILARFPSGEVIPDGTERERSACRRLVARGVLRRYRLGNSYLGYVSVYRVVQ